MRQQQIDDELAHIRDLVTLRSIIEARSATEEELRVCDAEIARHRAVLARLAAARPAQLHPAAA